ncbi:hypothetical protein D3C81_1232320 [compost metagenome]
MGDFFVVGLHASLGLVFGELGHGEACRGLSLWGLLCSLWGLSLLIDSSGQRGERILLAVEGAQITDGVVLGDHEPFAGGQVGVDDAAGDRILVGDQACAGS